MPQPPKFGLLDLVVVSAVVLIVGAMVLPAVQKMNIHRGRTESQNNIRQIAIAIQNFHDANNQRFPILCDYGEGSSTGQGVFSLFASIIPQLPEFDSVNTRPISPLEYYSSSKGWAKCQIKSYIDPRDSSAPGDNPVKAIVANPNPVPPLHASLTGTYATTSYAANGMMFQPGFGLKDIKDGTSSTIMLTTRQRVCKTAAGDTVYNFWGMGAYGASTPGFATPLPDGDKYPTTTPAMEQFVPPSSVPAKGEIAGRAGKAAMNYSDIARASKAVGGFQLKLQAGDPCDPRIPQSFWDGALLLCSVDVSTRHISGKVSPNVFWALVTPAGSDVIGDDW